MSITNTCTIGFLVLNNFTLMSHASAVEPLRMANQLSNRTLYHWKTLSVTGEPVSASDGMTITPDDSIETTEKFDLIVVCGGLEIKQQCNNRRLLQWLQRQARLKTPLAAVCTGSYILAKAGLLDGHRCTIHWENMASFKEEFPHIMVTNHIYSIDRDRLTCSGGTAPLDMMLNVIANVHGRELSASISEMFVHDRVRNEVEQQRIPLRHTLGISQPKLVEIVALMEANLEETISLDDLASYVGLSRRQLERLFLKYLDCSPSRYYLKLRLQRARQLLQQTNLSIIEIAAACGFISTPHFSKRYRDCFGIPPRDERLGLQVKVQPVAMAS
ncbi:GlxA family transcriptional regulator [Endozoicomonas sp. SM1973]|uniref:GlxA family transcriptional regulator n=1 Tax=Spartinivicinus marinus TaxID=2994442 RepID=A0A853I5U4_9GAMM|nr:GlxA family transcriptional regulator [Spartinivicinus marinus]MCX4026761.1 GlxA family transcriptional regulator [Spartinivicinus marinus]NYZ64595.1 GlxA family transcriptional regulator [Spartinivicinus marinus]